MADLPPSNTAQILVSAASLCTSLFACILAWGNVRRSHNNVVKRIFIEAGSSVSTENNLKPFGYLFFDVKNLGIPLHDARLKLIFDDVNGEGTVSLEFSRYDFSETDRPIDQ